MTVKADQLSVATGMGLDLGQCRRWPSFRLMVGVAQIVAVKAATCLNGLFLHYAGRVRLQPQ